MMRDEHCGCGEGHMYQHMHGPLAKEFKLALLEKKERILRAELEFVEKMKSLAAKMTDDQ